MVAAVRAAALLVGLVASLGGCGDDAPPPDAKLTVYVSTPLSGPDARQGLAVADGARDALAEAGGQAGGVEVEVTVVDAGPGVSAARPPRGGPDPVRAAANAREATQDSTATAYIGELDSKTTRTSLPITNDAGLLQISPTAGAADLLAPFEGSDEVPPQTQPSGERTFGTLAELDSDPRALGAEAMGLVLDAIARADDPLDRGSVVDAFLDTGERDSPLGPYVIDDVGRAQPLGGGAPG